MRPIRTDETNWDYSLPGRPGEGVMPCVRVLPTAEDQMGRTTSFWTLEPGDEIGAAEGLYLHVYGFRPDIRMGFGASLAEANLAEYALERHPEEGMWAGIGVDEEVREYLTAGGLFVLEVQMVPPPPVSVFLA